MLAGLAWVALQNSAPIANIAREQLAPDYPVEIGSITYPEKGVVEIRDVTLDHPDGNQRRSGSIERIRLRFPDGERFPTRFKSILIEKADVTLDDALLSMFAPKKPKDPAAPPTDLGWVKVDELKIVNGKVNLDLKGIPKGSWEIDKLEAEDIDLARSGDRLSPRPQRLVLRDIHIDDPENPSGPRLASADEIAIDFSLNKDFVSGAVASLTMKNPIVRHSPRLVAALEGDSAEPSSEKSESGSNKEPSTPMRWTIDKVHLDGGYFSMTDFYDTPDLSFCHSGTFTDLSWGSDTGLTWATPQKAALRDFRMDAQALPRPPGEFEKAETPVLIESSRIDLAGTPDDFFDKGWIDQIIALGTKINITETNTKRFFTAAPAGADDEAEDETDAGDGSGDEEEWIIHVRDLELADAKIKLNTGTFTKGLPEASINLNIRSDEVQPDPQNDVTYGLEISDLEVREPGETSKAFVTDGRILSSFTANGVQRDQRIESVTLSGINIRIGEEVERIIEELGKQIDVAEEEPEVPVSPYIAFRPDPITGAFPLLDYPRSLKPTEPEWTIGQLKLTDTNFELEEFIPGMPYVPVVLETTLTEIPLSGRDRGDERSQRVELHNLEIVSPYNSLLPVARLRTIWINFTIPGLIRNEIEKVEIVSPEIYLGEHLFWYVTFYSKLAAKMPDPDSEKEKIAAVSFDPCDGEPEPEVAEDPEYENAEEGKIDALEDAFKTDLMGWKINHVEASAGKLVVAPKGYQIGILPFPFDIKTNLTEGKIKIDLNVPSGDYVFEQLELELLGLSGDAGFTYPIKKKNNTFVQTFKVADLHFKEYRAKNVALAVTYDDKGIYGELWGEAYGGYVRGEFSIYIGETYTWDAWVTGTKLKLGPITSVLAPDTVKATGLIDVKLIANGEEFIPENVTGSMNTSGRCHMHVTKLDEVLESLPEPEIPPQEGRVDILDAVIEPVTAGLQHAMSKAGIEAFRHYDFTTGDAKLELVGRDGTASMILDGPDGKRDIIFRFFDKRELADTAEKKQ